MTRGGRSISDILEDLHEEDDSNANRTAFREMELRTRPHGTVKDIASILVQEFQSRSFDVQEPRRK